MKCEVCHRPSRRIVRGPGAKKRVLCKGCEEGIRSRELSNHLAAVLCDEIFGKAKR